MPARDNESLGAFIFPGLLALGREAPWRSPVLTTFGAAAMRMVDRVHRDAPVMRHAALPALPASLADRGIHVVGVGDGPYGRHASAMHQALLRRVEPKDHVVLIATDDLRIAAGRARDLTALPDLDLDIVDDGSDRNIGERHGIAGLYVGVLGRNHGIARGKALARQDIGQLAVLILDQRDEARAVRIIFQTFDGRRDIEFPATEIDPPIGLLVTTATESRGNAAMIIAATRRTLPLGERLHRRAFV